MDRIFYRHLSHGELYKLTKKRICQIAKLKDNSKKSITRFLTDRNTQEHRVNTLTDKRYGLWEELGQVLTPVVRNGDLLVPKVTVMLKHVGEVGRDVQDVLDVVLAQHCQVGGVFGAAQVQVG